MDIQQQLWDAYYQSCPTRSKDNWLQQYEKIVRPFSSPAILDLGCGNGSNIDFLLSWSNSIYACDYSREAIKHVKKHYPVQAMVVDMRSGLPYKDSFFDFVVSDLSLHYFSENETNTILKELCRISKPRATFLARVNSIKGKNYKEQQEAEIERNFFENSGVKKRFFDLAMIEHFFDSRFELLVVGEKAAAGKFVWELVVKKRA
jgi:SAM-dependent methyltransferase